MSLKLYYEGKLKNCDGTDSYMIRVLEPTKNLIGIFTVKSFKDGVVKVDVTTEFFVKPTIKTFIACFENSNLSEILKEIYPNEKSYTFKEIDFIFNGVEISVSKENHKLENLVRKYFRDCLNKKI